VELKHLSSFVVVATHLSFIRAARQLHISQPALTAQIQKLEAELGVQLLERNKRSVKLSEAGKLFLLDATALLEQARLATERVQKAANGEIGRIRVGFVSSAALEIVPGIALAFRKHRPQVSLDLINLQTASQVEGLLGRTIDVGFVRLPLMHEQLDVTAIHREEFVIALPREHRLARTRQLSLAKLSEEPFIAYGRRWAPGFFDAVIQMCMHQGFSPNIVQETGEMYTAIAMVAAGAGVAILPKSVAAAQPRGIVSKPLPKSVGFSEIAIAARKDDNSPLIKEFVATARRVCKQKLS
jgi:DNA-binding transcriptional LysR family regulator